MVQGGADGAGLAAETSSGPQGQFRTVPCTVTPVLFRLSSLCCVTLGKSPLSPVEGGGKRLSPCHPVSAMSAGVQLLTAQRNHLRSVLKIPAPWPYPQRFRFHRGALGMTYD